MSDDSVKQWKTVTWGTFIKHQPFGLIISSKSLSDEWIRYIRYHDASVSIQSFLWAHLLPISVSPSIKPFQTSSFVLFYLHLVFWRDSDFLLLKQTRGLLCSSLSREPAATKNVKTVEMQYVNTQIALELTYKKAEQSKKSRNKSAKR